MSIEQLAITAYITEQDHKMAKQMRAKILSTYPCLADYDDNSKCYNHFINSIGKHLDFEEWCENCKKTQSFHLDYRKKAIIANHAKGKLTNTIKKKLTPKCHLCGKKATWSQSPLGNPDELSVCDECHKKTNAQLTELTVLRQGNRPRKFITLQYGQALCTGEKPDG
jgi:hypothetical protein